MRLLIRAANFRAPRPPGGVFGFAVGQQGTSGSARPAAATGGEALGLQGTAGSATYLLEARGRQGTSGRASARFRAVGQQGTAGFATAAGQLLFGFSRTLALAPMPDLTPETITSYTAQIKLSGDWLKQSDLPGGQIAHPQAWDVRFETTAATPVALAHEIEAYDGVAGVLDVAIFFPSWATNQRLLYRVRYGADVA